MKKLALILFTLTFIQACGEKYKLEITGNVKQESTNTIKKMYLFQLVEQKLSRIDSAIVEANGDYDFKIKEEKKGIYFFGPNNMNVLTLVLNKNTNKVGIDIHDTKYLSNNYTVSGAEESENIANFTKHANAIRTKMMELQKKMATLKTPEEFGKAQVDGKALQDELAKVRGEFLKENEKSPAIIAALGFIDPYTELELLKTTVNNLGNAIPNSPIATQMKNDLEKLEKEIKQQEQANKQQELALPIGSTAPELDFPNPDGKNIKLSSLKGKVVLLDFWASWCRPCRAANPHVVSLYKKYKNKGFTVYSFSLDKDKERWKNAIKKDGLTWKHHTSDLKLWQTAAIGIYKFSSIPFTVLIDKNGNIAGKNLQGKALENKIKELL